MHISQLIFALLGATALRAEPTCSVSTALSWQSGSPAKLTRQPRLDREADRPTYQLVDNLFEVEASLRAGDHRQLTELAKRLLNEGKKSANTGAQRGALLDEAIRVATSAGDVSTLKLAVAEMETHFIVDGPTLLLDSALAILSHAPAERQTPELIQVLTATAQRIAKADPERARATAVAADAHLQRIEHDPQRLAQTKPLVDALWASLAPRATQPTAPIQRLPVPPQDHRRRTTRERLDATLDTLPSLTRGQQYGFLASALSLANNPGCNPAEQYENLEAVIQGAAITDHPELARAALQAMCERFQVPEAKTRYRSAVLCEAGKVIDAEKLVGMFMDAAHSGMPDDLITARAAVDSAGKQLHRLRYSGSIYTTLAKRLHELTGKLADLECEQQLRDAVRRQPDSFQANEELGWFLCTQRELWADGLPLLAKGAMRHVSGISPSDLARLELGPTHDDDQSYAIAESWWTLACHARTTETERGAICRHAAHWYGRVQHIQDLRRAIIRQRLGKAGGRTPAEPAQAPAASQATTTPGSNTSQPAPEAAGPQHDPAAAVTSGAGKWQVRGKELVQTGLVQDAAVLVFGDPTWTDYDFSCRALAEAGSNGFKLLYHVTEEGSSEFAVGNYGNVGSDRSYVYRGKWGRDDSLYRSGAVNLRQWHTARIEVRGARVRCFLDDALMFDSTDQRFTRGRLGLATWHATVRFKDIVVTSPSGTVLFEGLPKW